jgi:cytochrome c oxidase subunit 3
MTTASNSHSGFHHAHHFKNAEHQYSSSKQGIWLFLCTEILMFGGLFVGYLIFQSLYPEVFHIGSKHLDWKLGAFNTVVLLVSSFTMAAAIHYVQTGKKQPALINLIITIICALIFMVVKYFEYSHKIHEGTLPGHFFTTDLFNNVKLVSNGYEAALMDPKKIGAVFYGFYFIMTGLHGLHVVAGATLIGWITLKVASGKVGPEYYTPVEGVGLFWHVVDLVWIYLFPLLYLVG